jgi:hypothetical protein
MTVYVLIREDQNDHGFVDFSIVGIFHEEHAAHQFLDAETARARELGLRVEDEERDVDVDWQVSWKIEDHLLSALVRLGDLSPSGCPATERAGARRRRPGTAVLFLRRDSG